MRAGQRQKRTAPPRPISPWPGLARALQEAAALRLRLPRAGRRQSPQRCPAAYLDRLRPPRQPPRLSPRCPSPLLRRYRRRAPSWRRDGLEGRAPASGAARIEPWARGTASGLPRRLPRERDAGHAAACVVAAKLAVLAPQRLFAAPAGATETRCLPVPRSAANGYKPLARVRLPPSAERLGGVEAGEAAEWGALHVRMRYKSDAAFPASDSDLALPSLQAHMWYKSDATVNMRPAVSSHAVEERLGGGGLDQGGAGGPRTQLRNLRRQPAQSGSRGGGGVGVWGRGVQ